MERTCSSCHAVNRIPPRHAAHQGKCGTCKAPLPASPAPVDVHSAQEFDALLRNVPEPVLVDFYADWCGPCRAAAPHVAALAREMAGQVVVLKVNTDKVPDVAARYNIRSIPTFMVFHKGQQLIQHAGMVDRSTMAQWLH